MKKLSSLLGAVSVLAFCAMAQAQDPAVPPAPVAPDAAPAAAPAPTPGVTVTTSTTTGATDDTIVGNRGNDYMEGAGGSDRFVLKPGDGWDCIGDFQGGAGGDVLDLQGWGGIGSLEDVLAHSHQDRDGLVLDFGPRDGVKLMGLSRDDLLGLFD